MIPDKRPDQKAQRETDLLAFVQGEINVAAMQEAVRHMDGISSDIYEGSIKDMAKYLSKRSSPKVLLVDVSHSDLPLSELNDLADVCDPSVQVIVVGSRNDVGLYRDLMNMGVFDYLVTPILPDLVVRSVQAALSGEDRPASSASREGKVLTFISSRGGSGSTTIATSLGWLLAVEKKRRVVVVDMNLHLGTVSLYFDLRPDHGLREALENPDRVDEVFVDRLLVKVNDRLEVLSSEEPLDSFPEFDFEGFHNLLKALKKKFHYVILDVPRRFNRITHHVISNSDVMMIVADPSLAAIRDVDRYYRQFGVEQEGRRVITILNKLGQYRKGEVSPEDFERATSRPIHHILPYDATVPLDCANKGVVLSSVDSKVKASLQRIVSDLTGGVVVESKNKGLFGKIKSLLSS